MQSAAALPAEGNLFAALPASADGEVFQTLFVNPACRIERIASCGHASPSGFWYEQGDDEWVVLLAGTARLDFADGRQARMKAGDWVTLSAGCRHRVAEVSADALWLAVHCRAATAK